MRLALVLFLSCMGGCRIFMSEKYDRLERCAKSLPIYRDGNPPEREYRIIEVVQAKGDYDLAYQACDLGANALMDVGYISEFKTKAMVGVGRISVGSSKTKERILLRGTAVIFTDY